MRRHAAAARRVSHYDPNYSGNRYSKIKARIVVEPINETTRVSFDRARVIRKSCKGTCGTRFIQLGSYVSGDELNRNQCNAGKNSNSVNCRRSAIYKLNFGGKKMLQVGRSRSMPILPVQDHIELRQKRISSASADQYSGVIGTIANAPRTDLLFGFYPM